MAAAPRAYIVAALGAVAVLGVALGADLQKETFLHPERLMDVGNRDAASNLIVLTALIPAIAVAAAASLLSTRPWPRRIGPASGLGAATWATVTLLQSAWPNYDAIVEQRAAQFSITPLISNGDAVPSTFLGPLAILVGLGLAARVAWRRLVPPSPEPVTPEGALQRAVAAYALAVPFLAIVVAGNIRLAIAFPDVQASTGAYLVVFPLSGLAALGLLVTGAIKLWHLGAFVRNGRLADAADDAWHALRRIEWVLAAVLGGLALLATALPATNTALLEAGRTFSLTTRGHVQAQLFLVFPLLPWLTLDAHVRTALQVPDRARTLAIATHPMVAGVWAAAAASLLLAILVSWTAGGALWPWAAACVPVVALAGFLPARHALGAPLVLATVLWGIGNTIVGTFALRETAALTVETAPGVLSLLRVLAVMVAAWAVGRHVRATAQVRPSLAWPLAGAVGAALALVVFLEGSFTAWIAPTADGEFVGIGSLVASLDLAVRTTIHVVTSFAGLGAALAIARIVRPDWFGRPPPAPLDVPVGSAA